MIPTYTISQTNLTTSNRGPFQKILWLVHETAGVYPSDLERLTESGEVSVNWYIRRSGQIICLDPQFRATAHAGVASWINYDETQQYNGWGWANLASEGVELEGLNKGTPITDAQFTSLVDLSRWRIGVLKIQPHWVVRHSDIAMPWGRKSDPKGLDWASFLTALYPTHLSIQAAPRCTQDQFMDLLRQYSSPAYPEGEAIYKAFTVAGIDPTIGLSFFEHESRCGTTSSISGLLDQKNWGNIRIAMTKGVGQRNGFAVYPTWLAGAQDFIAKMVYYWTRYGVSTVERAIPIYAPTSDGNRPDIYISSVVERVQSMATQNSAVIPPMSPKLDGLHGPIQVPQLFYDFYQKIGGLVTIGYPIDAVFFDKDRQGEECQWLLCENGAIKFKSSQPIPWNIRLASIEEVVDLFLSYRKGSLSQP